MKKLKILGLLATVVLSLMASAGSASAATFTAPAGTEYTGSVDLSLRAGFFSRLKAAFTTADCNSMTVQGKISTNNDTEASGSISGWSFTGCESSTVDTLNSTGTLTILKADTKIRLTGTETTVSAMGTSCVYGGGSGTILGSATNTASGVEVDVVTELPKISGGFLCGSSAEWTAKLIFTSPSKSVID
jgi:hypothetical protein